MRPLRKVPVVMMTASAEMVRPSRRRMPRQRREGSAAKAASGAAVSARRSVRLQRIVI